SSRRRHTRSTRDWSSDVCSSDLLMKMNERMLAQLATKITGSTVVKYGELALDFGRIERLSMREAICKYWPAAAGVAPTVEELAEIGRAAWREKGVDRGGGGGGRM